MTDEIGRVTEETEPLWTDERIDNVFWLNGNDELAHDAAKMRDQYEAERKHLLARIEHLQTGYGKELELVEQELGAALGYPRYCDDQVNFPGTTEADGVCVGEHVAGTIAMEAAGKIAKLEAKLNEVYDLLAVMNESSSIVASERQSEIAELEAIKASMRAKAQLESATNPTDARIDALIMSIATYTASVPVMPERDVAMAAMREIVRGWMNE